MIWALYSEVFRALGFGYDIIKRKRNSAGLRDIGGLVAGVFQRPSSRRQILDAFPKPQALNYFRGIIRLPQMSPELEPSHLWILNEFFSQILQRH